jgi:hypothetical protein
VTGPTQGAAGPRSVVALAIEVNGLRHDVESLTTRADEIARTHDKHAAAIDGIPELRRQVDRILALLTDDQAEPTGWFWLTMDAQAREDRLGELTDWAENVLCTQYPGYLAEQIRPCWPNHPEALWELTWLYLLWCRAYLAKRPAPKDAADWHDRWAPGVLRRLAQVMDRCDGHCQREALAAALDSGTAYPETADHFHATGPIDE